MNINGLVATRGNAPISGQEWSAAGRINALAVLVQPGADFAEAVSLRLVNSSVAVRADVQKQVGWRSGKM